MSAIVCCCVSSDWGGGSDAWQVFVRESLSLQECDDTRKMPKHADILPQSEYDNCKHKQLHGGPGPAGGDPGDGDPPVLLSPHQE